MQSHKTIKDLENKINAALHKEDTLSGNYAILRLAQDYLIGVNDINRQCLLTSMGTIPYDKTFLSVFSSSTQSLLNVVISLSESDVKRYAEIQQAGKAQHFHANDEVRFKTIR